MQKNPKQCTQKTLEPINTHVLQNLKSIIWHLQSKSAKSSKTAMAGIQDVIKTAERAQISKETVLMALNHLKSTGEVQMPGNSHIMVTSKTLRNQDS